jgi:hypothetical protein
MAATHSQPLRYKGVDVQHHISATLPRERTNTGCVSLGAGLEGHGKTRSALGSETRTAQPLVTFCTDYGVQVLGTNILFNSSNEAVRNEACSFSHNHFTSSRVFLGTQVLSLRTVQSAILSAWPAQFRANVLYFALDIF